MMVRHKLETPKDRHSINNSGVQGKTKPRMAIQAV